MKTGEEVEIVGLKDEKKKTVVTGIEMFRMILDYAEAGDKMCIRDSPMALAYGWRKAKRSKRARSSRRAL